MCLARFTTEILKSEILKHLKVIFQLRAFLRAFFEIKFAGYMKF